MKLNVDGKIHDVDVEPDMPLLWVLRDELKIYGVKYGCGIAQCGACTVHLDGAPIRSCSYPASAVGDRAVTTIEGLASADSATGSTDGEPQGALHAVQAAWIEEQVAQCGYCQSGQIMTAAAFLKQQPNPTDEDIDRAMSGNLCRCGAYPRIRAAVYNAARRLAGSDS